MKKTAITITVAFVLIAGIFLLVSKNKTSQKFQTEEIKKCTLTEVVEASGTINPVNTISVGSTVSGLIKEIYVDYNSQVKKGQILAQIDPTTLESALQQNLASINNARATLEQKKAVVEMSKKTYTRYKNLYAKNFVAKSELDQAESDYKLNLAQVRAAQAQIAQAQAQYKTASANLSYTKILAPVDGTIISRKADVGQSVAASFQAPELFTIAQDLTKMQIEVNVSEADIGKVKEGQEVFYTLDGYPDREFKGKVSQVRLASTTTSNVVTYSVIVDVENNDLTLKPGMSANVSIITKKSENVLCVPNEALKFSLKNDEKYDKQGVWILKGFKPERVEIEIGIGDDLNTEITEGDIKEGDKIITGSFEDKKNARHKPPGMF